MSPSSPLSSRTTVLIRVVDVQDQPPVFQNAPYSVLLQENTETDKAVLSFKASDGDFGNPRPVSVSISKDPLGMYT